MFRAVPEGIGYALEHHAEILRDQGLMPGRIVAADASGNLFMQVISDIMDSPQDYMAKVSGASNAFPAELGVGIIRISADQGLG